MSCYFIAQIQIHDQLEYDTYLAGFDKVFDRYQGEVLAVDDRVSVLEGNWPYTRSVLIRFPDQSAALKWYRSPEYQHLAQHRWNASTANIVLLEGRGDDPVISETV
jgi:uncharacterized protein (DUF1330 family)